MYVCLCMYVCMYVCLCIYICMFILPEHMHGSEVLLHSIKGRAPHDHHLQFGSTIYQCFQVSPIPNFGPLSKRIVGLPNNPNHICQPLRSSKPHFCFQTNCKNLVNICAAKCVTHISPSRCQSGMRPNVKLRHENHMALSNDVPGLSWFDPPDKTE